jgi:hypothetical protein
VTPENAYDVWQSHDGSCTYWVLKKYKNPIKEENDLFARWYVATKSPGTFGSYEYGDMYAANIKAQCIKIDNPLYSYACVRLDDETTFSLNQLLTYRYQSMRPRHVQLVNYMRLAIPKKKLDLFKQIAKEHTLVIVCIDGANEVEACLHDFHNERIRQLQEGEREYQEEQNQLRRQREEENV